MGSSSQSATFTSEFGHEFEQNFGWNHGLTRKAFNEFEGQTELEYGLSDQIQLAVATSYSWAKEHDRSLLSSPYESGTTWGGIEGEMIWQAMNVYFDPIGLGVLVAPSVGPYARGVEAKFLLQKNFLNDRLRFVINTGGEVASEKEDGAWGDVSGLTFNAGLAYDITWEWSLGVEFNAEHDFDGLLVNGKAVPVATTYFVGPTLQYLAHPWTASLSVLSTGSTSSGQAKTRGPASTGHCSIAPTKYKTCRGAACCST